MLKVKLIIRFNKDDRKEKRSLATSFIGGIVSYTHTHTHKNSPEHAHRNTTRNSGEIAAIREKLPKQVNALARSNTDVSLTHPFRVI